MARTDEDGVSDLVGQTGKEDLRLLLRDHALEAHALSEKMRREESDLVDFLFSGEDPNPEVTMKLVTTLDRLRASAGDDFRRSVALLEEAGKRPAPVQIAVVNQNRAEVRAESTQAMGPGHRRELQGS